MKLDSAPCDSSTFAMKCIVPLACGGELLEPDGFYLSSLSHMGWTLGKLPLWTSTLHLWARHGIIYAPLLPSSLPLPLVELSLKRHRGLACQAEAQRCDEILPYRAVLRYVEVRCKASKKEFPIFKRHCSHYICGPHFAIQMSLILTGFTWL